MLLVFMIMALKLTMQTHSDKVYVEEDKHCMDLLYKQER